MACSYTLSGITRGCKDSIGGISKVWFAGFDDVQYDINYETSHEGDPAYDLGTISIDANDVSAFKVYNFRRNTGSMTSTLNTSDTAGNSYTTEVVLQFLKQELDKRNEIQALSMSELKAIVKDGNGKYYALGLDYPIDVTAATAETGTANTDLNGYNLTVSDYSVALPHYVVDSSTIAALEAITIA